MNRYIKLSDAIKSIEDLQDCYNGYSDTYDKACIIGVLEELPSVDAVPVVRCKDCKWLDCCDTQEGREYLCCREGFPVDLNGFCSCGEKVTK